MNSFLALSLYVGGSLVPDLCLLLDCWAGQLHREQLSRGHVVASTSVAPVDPHYGFNCDMLLKVEQVNATEV